MKLPFISIIIPCYNQAQYLPETLDSVLRQTYEHWECIIVNDGSTDNTQVIAQNYCAKDERFRYLPKENGGVSAARNMGIQHSTGSFILPLDSDDIIADTYVEKAIRYFEAHPETKLVYCKAEFFGEIKGQWDLPPYHYQRLLLQNIIFCSAVYRRESYDSSAGYNENMSAGNEDWDFWLTFLNADDVVYQIPEICFYYRIRSNSRNRTIDGLNDLNRKLVQNHLDQYMSNITDIVNIHETILHDSEARRDTYILYLENQISQLVSSKAYRLGKFLLRPLNALKTRLKK